MDQKIDAVQALRAIAACAVVGSHAISRVGRTWDLNLDAYQGLADLGHAGVDLFFVLSGFLMTHLHIAQFGKGAGVKFFRRRLVRIVPIYWILSTVGFAMWLLAPDLFTYHKVAEWPWVVGVYLFFPWPQADGNFDPILGDGWTLNYEMFFYLAFAIALRWTRGLAMLVALFLCLVMLGAITQPVHPWAGVVTSPLLLEFLMGIAVALIARLPPMGFTALSAGIAGFAVSLAFATYAQDRVRSWGVPAALVLLGIVWIRPKCKGLFGRSLVTLGDASYSIYLLQVFALPAIALLLRFAGVHLPAPALVAILIVGTAAAGVAFWWAFERPMTNWLRGYLRRS